MILLSFYHSVEFYVIAFLIAAVIVAFSMKPRSITPVKTHLLDGRLFWDYNVTEKSPAIELVALEDGTVRLIRRGLEQFYDNGAVSLAVNVKGFDISIEERIVLGKDFDVNASYVNSAEFEFSFMGRERYHISYNSETFGLFAATTFNNVEGYRAVRELKTM